VPWALGVYRGPPEVYRGPCMKNMRQKTPIIFTPRGRPQAAADELSRASVFFVLRSMLLPMLCV